MNLHGLVTRIVAAVNPTVSAGLRISNGSTITADGTRVPAYETPGSLTGSISGTVLTITAIASGKPASGQVLAGTGILANTLIENQISGAPGGTGTYAVNQAQTVLSTTITTDLIVPAQVQPMTWRDLQQLEGLNLGGERRKIYLYGATDSVVRVQAKGGDVITLTDGFNSGVWLIAQSLEQWPDWCSVAATLQNGS